MCAVVRKDNNRAEGRVADELSWLLLSVQRYVVVGDDAGINK